MAPTVVQTRIAVFINDVQVRTTGDVLINESLDSLCRVCEFEMAEQPTAEPVEGDTVLVQWLDYDGELAYDLFGGKVNAIEIESDPWSFIVRCTDQLEKLRRVPATDHSFTGQTVKETIEEILDACDVDYDDADLTDITYVLGAEVDVKWLEGVPGSQVAAEVNDVFGMTLATIGNNRVIWFRTDLPPADATGKYRDYEKSVDADFNANRRSHGDRDAIQNYWLVNGASIPCGTADACSCQIWAKAIDSNPQLGGRRIRTAPQTSTSDLIQDEALAEYIVRRQMRLTNRLPDTATVETSNDPNVHPGTKVGLIDATYGIDAASARNCTVTAVDRTGPGMTLACMCGTPGEEGTVTTGYQKVCNGTNSDLDLPGSFDPPDFDWPPIDLGTGFDPGDFFLFDPPILVIGGTPDTGGGSDGCSTGSWADLYGEWNFATPGTVVFTGHPNNLCGGVLGAVYSGYAFDATDLDGTKRVRVTGHGAVTSFTDPSIFIGLQSADETGSASGFDASTAGTNVYSWTGFDSDPWDLSTGIDFALDWNPDTDTFKATINGTTYTQSLGAWPAAARRVVIAGNGNDCGMVLTVTDLEICVTDPSGDLLGIVGDWEELSANMIAHIGFIDSPYVQIDGTGAAWNTGFDVDHEVSWTLTGTMTMTAGGATYDFHFGIGFDDDVEVLVTGGDTTVFYLQSPGGSDSLPGPSFDPDVPMTITLDWNAGTQTLTGTITQGVRTEMLSYVDAAVPSGGTNHPFISFEGDGTGGLELTALSLVGG